MESEVNNGILFIYPKGEVGKSEELDVNAVGAMMREQGIERVIFDLSECKIITSPGFGWIFGVARECKRANVAVATCNANDMVARSIKWVNGNLVMHVCLSRAEAIAIR
ncbi:MAG: STAS domain-containing protein [Planctomycetes bacterium]|nr:STAS domain-containing protein [Planctomycetota bacterium]